MPRKAFDPTEWANKKNAAVERAKQIRAERKNGNLNEEMPSFTPQVNKRPSYLPNPEEARQLNRQSSLGSVASDDIFEQPLPGSKSYSVSSVGGGGPGNGSRRDSEQIVDRLSPSSDALGREMKNQKFFPSNKVSGGGSGSNGGHGYAQPKPQYQSKFMQQYTNEVENVPNQSSSAAHANANAAAAEADAVFANQLRGGPSKQLSSKNAWNDDTSTARTFDEMNKKPSRSRRPRGHLEGGDSGAQSSKSEQASKAQLSRPDWNSDPYSANAVPVPTRAPQRQTYNARDNDNYVEKETMNTAKSRLSLLKSKMRKSESGNGLRKAEPMGDEEYLMSMPHSAPPVDGRVRNVPSPTDFSNEDNESAFIVGRSHGPGGGGVSIGQKKNMVKPSIGMSGHRWDSRDSADDEYRSMSSNDQNRRTSESEYNPIDLSRGGRQARIHRVESLPTRTQSQETYGTTGRSMRRPLAGSVREEDEDDLESSAENSSSHYGLGKQRSKKDVGAPKIDSRSDRKPAQYNNTSIYEQAAMEAAEAEEEVEQVECPDCGRKFNPSSYEKHVKICKKVFMQKRKKFDSTQMRVADNPELAKINAQREREERALKRQAGRTQARMDAKKGTGGMNDDSSMWGSSVQSDRKPTGPERVSGPFGTPQESSLPKSKVRPAGTDRPIQSQSQADKKAKWKEQSNAFRDAMRAARAVTKAIENGDPLPPPTTSAPDSSLVPCPHCGRRFSEKAADRHIPQCQNIKAKPTMLRRGAGGGGGITGQVKKTPGRKF